VESTLRLTYGIPVWLVAPCPRETRYSLRAAGHHHDLRTTPPAQTAPWGLTRLSHR